VGAGVAVTGGVKRLPPFGLRLFSVGAGGELAGGGAVVVVLVVVVVDEGAWLPLVPQAAVKPTSTAADTTAIRRRSIICTPPFEHLIMILVSSGLRCAATLLGICCQSGE
jgi:hypothetical protein